MEDKYSIKGLPCMLINKRGNFQSITRGPCPKDKVTKQHAVRAILPSSCSFLFFLIPPLCFTNQTLMLQLGQATTKEILFL